MSDLSGPSVAAIPKERFYRETYPIIPAFLFRKGDEHNSTSIAVKWLCFHICDEETGEVIEENTTNEPRN